MWWRQPEFQRFAGDIRNSRRREVAKKEPSGVPKIAPTAVVDRQAEVADDVVIGPGCVIEADVVIGPGCELRANVMVCRGTRMGRENRVFAGCVLGEEPQITRLDRSIRTELVIGDQNVFREYVTISRGSPHGGGKTLVGNGNYLMAYSHLGHDVEMEDHVVLANVCQIAGYCRIERNAWLSGCAGTHQFVTIGRFAYAAACAVMVYDIPPFVKVAGSYPCEVRGVNATGLRRAGVADESVAALGRACRRLYWRKDGQTLAAALTELAAQDGLDENVRYLLDAVQRSTQSRMGRYRERLRHR
jgi:UDP-N-acetylglucosamine acyltransferase